MKKNVKRIIALLMVITMILSLTACGEIKKAEATINNTFAALKALDFDTAATYLNLDDIMTTDDAEESLDLDKNLFMESIFGKLSHEIISSEKVDENTVIVKTKISTIDMKPVIGDYFSKALQYAFASAFADPQPTEEETTKKMTDLFIECISKENLAMVSNEVDIRVVKVDDSWKIESENELSNALLGGLLIALEELSNSFANAD